MPLCLNWCGVVSFLTQPNIYYCVCIIKYHNRATMVRDERVSTAPVGQINA